MTYRLGLVAALLMLGPAAREPALAGTPPPPPPPDLIGPTTLRVTLHASNIPFEEAVRLLNEAVGGRIVVKWEELKSAYVTPEQKVSCACQNTSLEDALRLLTDGLRRGRRVGWYWDKGKAIITAQKEVDAHVAEELKADAARFADRTRGALEAAAAYAKAREAGVAGEVDPEEALETLRKEADRALAAIDRKARELATRDTVLARTEPADSVRRRGVATLRTILERALGQILMPGALVNEDAHLANVADRFADDFERDGPLPEGAGASWETDRQAAMPWMVRDGQLTARGKRAARTVLRLAEPVALDFEVTLQVGYMGGVGSLRVALVTTREDGGLTPQPVVTLEPARAPVPVRLSVEGKGTRAGSEGGYVPALAPETPMRLRLTRIEQDLYLTVDARRTFHLRVGALTDDVMLAGIQLDGEADRGVLWVDALRIQAPKPKAKAAGAK